MGREPDMSLNRKPSTANDNREIMPNALAGRQLATAEPRSPTEALTPMRLPDKPEEPDEPEEDRHPFLRMFDGLFTFIFVLICLAAVGYYFIKTQFDKPGPSTTSTVVVIPRGEGVSAIADRLERDGVIADRRVFMTGVLYFKYLKGQGTLKAGEYEFPKQASIRRVLDTIVEGKSIEHKVTLAEGLTSQQIVQKLLDHPELAGEIEEVPPEGSLLPDTYKFGSKDTRQNIIDRMRLAREKFLAKVWETRDPDIMVSTPEEAMVLASIVEKETGRADERPRVAAVFHNRLKKRMRLQSDPTIIYGLVGGKGALDGPITREQLDRETPYNTYKINGLPPGPIANPGRASIEAVLRPAKTNDVYFVADGTGGHVFAATLDEHNRNVAKWRAIEREIRRKEAEAAAAAAAAAEAAGADPEAAAAAAAQQATGAAPAAVPGAVIVDPNAEASGMTFPGDLLEADPETPADGGAVPAPRRNPSR